MGASRAQIEDGHMVTKDWGWLNDPTIKRLGNGGKPPDGHVRRCQSRNNFLSAREGKDVQCGRWAIKGRTYCARHGGAEPRRKKNVAGRRWYSKHAGATLKAKLEEMAEAAPDERNSLEAEIDLARVLAIQTIACFDKVCVEGDTGTADAMTAQLMKAQATAAARDAMVFVSSIVEKAARVRASSEGTIDLELASYIVHQVQAVIERHIVPLPNGHELCDKITLDLNDIRMPNRQHEHVSAEDRAAEVRDLLGAMDTSVLGAGMNGHSSNGNGNGAAQ